MTQVLSPPDIIHSIVYVNPHILNPAEYNPRKHTSKQIESLKESISRYGLVDPILVNKHSDRMNIVVWGHFRLKIAKQMWMTEVPVIYLDLPLEKEKELNLRLNQNTGDWDYELLKDFDLDLLLDVGFGNEELSSVWDEMLGVEDDGFKKEKELEEIKTPIAKYWDIYALWDHRIMCGDSTKEDDVKKLIESLDPWQTIRMIYYDAPYNIWLDYSKWLSNGKSYGGKKTNDAKTKEEYSIFLEKALHNGLRYAEKDVHVFMWCDPNYIGLIQSLYESLGITSRRVCLWVKNNMNATPNVAFNRAYEPCVYGTKWKPPLSKEFRNLHEILDKEVWVGNQVLDDISDMFDIWLAKRLATVDYEHPTEKNPTLHEKSLKKCTNVGDTVIDFFGWSGSTLIACEQLKRRAVLMEYEPTFIDLIIKRYEKLTGNKARKLN